MICLLQTDVFDALFYALSVKTCSSKTTWLFWEFVEISGIRGASISPKLISERIRVLGDTSLLSKFSLVVEFPASAWEASVRIGVSRVVPLASTLWFVLLKSLARPDFLWLNMFGDISWFACLVKMSMSPSALRCKCWVWVLDGLILLRFFFISVSYLIGIIVCWEVSLLIILLVSR